MSEQLFLHTLHFINPAGTSRGILHTKPSWIYHFPLENGSIAQTEFSIIPGLSPEYENERQYARDLQFFIEKCRAFIPLWSKKPFFEDQHYLEFTKEWRSFPSFLFGLELLLFSIQAKGSKRLFDTAFTRKETQIPINGLVWMDSLTNMRLQAQEKLALGYKTVKIKIGALDWHQELSLLRELRMAAGSELTLRVDANGAFTTENVHIVLNELASLEVHSIEQPIAVGQRQKMSELIVNSPIPIALDEELIGIQTMEEKAQFLDVLRPQYIILKPSLHGGFLGVREWISLAEARKIGWWLTSALESAIGLSAIVQFGSTYDLTLPQGFGTGGIYRNNFESDLIVEKGSIAWINGFGRS